MKVLITGGAGFIGANLCRQLQGSHEVTVYDNLSRGSASYLPDGVSLVEGDILDSDTIENTCAGMDAVIHLAAYGSVVESVSDPVSNFHINAEGTFCVLEAARKNATGKFVFASTGGALMGNTPPPVNELSLPKPISPYGSSKLVGEAYCHAYAMSYGLNTICLRFANIYGPVSAHKKGVITRYIKQIFRGLPLTIYGDGTSSRDYLHVYDLCCGIQAAVEADSRPGEVLHMASGRETAIEKLAHTLLELAGKSDYQINYEPARQGEVDRNCANYAKAAAVLGFKPERSLRDGLAETYAWFSERVEEVLNMEESDS